VSILYRSYKLKLHIYNSAKACADDESVDCARLNSLFSICSDVAHARSVCAKFCGLCVGMYYFLSNYFTLQHVRGINRGIIKSVEEDCFYTKQQFQETLPLTNNNKFSTETFTSISAMVN
jgi:hypothetical protein